MVERGSEKRVLASIRVVARNEKNQPEFLIALFDDVTDRRSLSQELENAKKFLELVVDNIPVSLIVERVSDGRYLLANRSAETILNRRREEATGLTAADIFNPQGSQADHRARRGGDQEARPAGRRTSDQHQGRAAAVPDPPHDGAG